MFTESTSGRPVLVNQDNWQLVMAWNSVSRTSRMNVMTSTDGFTWDPNSKITIPTEATSGSPGLAYDPSTRTTFIAWSGNDTGHHLNFLQSNVSVLNVWTNKRTVFTDGSVYGPALAFGAGLLFVAWADDGAAGKIHVATTIDGGASWKSQVMLPERSDAQPSLVFNNNKLILSWKGISPNQQLSFVECTDFTALTFVNKVVIVDEGNSVGDPGVHSNVSPSVAFDADGLAWLSWVTASRDNLKNGILNQIISEKKTINGFADIPSYHRQFRAFKAGLGPALCFFKGKMFIAWQADSAPHQLEIAVLNRGSVVVYGLLPRVL